MKRKYKRPSTKMIELRQSMQMLAGSGGDAQGQMHNLESFDNGGDPLAD